MRCWPAVVILVDNLREASVVNGVEVLAPEHSGSYTPGSRARQQLDERVEAPTAAPEVEVDLADVVGQSHAR